MRRIIVGVVVATGLALAIGNDTSAQPCNRDCPAADKDEVGCCPVPKPRTRMLPPAPVVDPPSPPSPRGTAQRRDEVKKLDLLAAEAANTGDREKSLACGQAYLDAYNKEPEATDNDYLLDQGATCYARARSLGVAIQMYSLIEKYYPRSQHALRAHLQLGNLFAAIAFYDRAADKLEAYAKSVPNRPDALEALSDAAFFRKGIGDDERALADARDLIRLYGPSRQPDAAAAHFGMLSIYEKRGDTELAIKHLRDYVKTYGELGGADRLITAHAKLGDLILRGSCPVRPVDGLCATLTRERRQLVATTKTKIPATCGTTGSVRRAIVARKDVSDALAAFGAATKLYEAKRGKTGGFEPGALHFYAMARLAAVDLELENYLGMAVPPKLDATWFANQAKAAELVRAKYEVVVQLGDPRATVAASARIAQLAQTMADWVAGEPIPKTITAPDQYASYCDQLVAPWRKIEVAGYQSCVEKASKLDVLDEWSAVCDRELSFLTPDKLSERDAIAEPLFITPQIELAAPAVAPGPGPLASALEELRKNTTQASCSRIAKLFEKTAATDAPTAFYMAGYTYQRCGMLVEAVAAYDTSNKKKPNAPALTNLGVIDHANGKPDDAAKQWDAALKIDGKAYAARVDSAIVEYGKLIEIANPRDPAARKLDEDARFQLSNAVAVRDDSARGYVLMALLYMHGAEANRNRLDLARFLLDEAKRADDKDPLVHVALGVLAVRRGQATLAISEFQAGAKDPDGALDFALLDLQLRKYDDAAKLLAAIKPTRRTEYAIQIAIGAAARGQGKLADADAAYRRALKLDGQRAEAYFDLGLLAILSRAPKESDPVKAAAIYRQGRDHMVQALARAGDGPIKVRATDAIADVDKALAKP